MPQSSDCEIASVTTTVGSMDAARALAGHILKARLAACVQLDHGVTSLYHWAGELCEASEVRLVIKTTPDRVSVLQALFASEHPYELPQFLVTSTRASPAYARWVRSQAAVQPPSPGSDRR
jgi:periplasmic divalent cation tolerance protein